MRATLSRPNKAPFVETALPPEVVDIPTACQFLGLGRSKVYRMIGTGELPTVKLGTRRLVRLETMRRMLAELESAGGPKAA
jgi:excisionase family DNA binding protein